MYLEDCLQELIERAKESAQKSDSSNSDFDKGHSLAYNEAISFLINQTEIFEIKNELCEKLKSFITPL